MANHRSEKLDIQTKTMVTWLDPLYFDLSKCRQILPENLRSEM